MKSTNRAKDAMVKRHWLSAATVLLLTASAVASQQWRRYINGRFGTAADVLRLAPEGPGVAADMAARHRCDVWDGLAGPR